MITDQSQRLSEAKVDAFDAILELLYPAAEPNQEWDGGTIERVADEVLRVMPGAYTGNRTPRDLSTHGVRAH
jgi:hypothetical protein